MAENGHFLTKKAKHGRLAPDSTKPNGNALMGHMTTTYMGKHVLGPFCSLATPKNGRKWHKNCPFLTKKAKHGRPAFDSAKPNGHALMGHMTSTYMGNHVLGPFCSLATPKNGRKWPKNCPFLTKKKPSMAGLLLTQPNQMETL